jgi:uncharacterized protein (DUF488 family)
MTIGHSTHTAERFLALLQAHGVAAVADVRRIPQSRRHPHFSRESLGPFLNRHGIAYEHFPGLGGLRKPQKIRRTADGGTRRSAGMPITCVRRSSPKR